MKGYSPIKPAKFKLLPHTGATSRPKLIFFGYRLKHCKLNRWIYFLERNITGPQPREANGLNQKIKWNTKNFFSHPQ